MHIQRVPEAKSSTVLAIWLERGLLYHYVLGCKADPVQHIHT